MRCYNGAWDSEAQALFAEQDRLFKELQKAEPEAHRTCFPEEERWQIHVWGRPLSGFHSSMISALTEALKKVKAETGA
jgi:hypothetical protein